MQTVALRQELMLHDIKLLLYFSQADESGNLKEIAAVTHLKKTKIILSLQKLMAKDFIKMKNLSIISNEESQDRIEVEFLPESESVLQDIMTAIEMYSQVKYAGLSEEEIEQYEAVSNKIRSNVQKSLK